MECPNSVALAVHCQKDPCKDWTYSLSETIENIRKLLICWKWSYLQRSLCSPADYISHPNYSTQLLYLSRICRHLLLWLYHRTRPSDYIARHFSGKSSNLKLSNEILQNPDNCRYLNMLSIWRISAKNDGFSWGSWSEVHPSEDY